MKVKLDDQALAPQRSYNDDAGFDLRTCYPFKVPAGGSFVVDTGIHCEIPVRHYGKLESKSGLMVNHGIVCPGGVVDHGYTGNIKVMLENHSDRDYWFDTGDRICQMIVAPFYAPPVQIVEELDETERGDNGFGSTGR